MELVCGVLIIIVGGAIGMLCEVYRWIESPSYYWFLGAITGIVATIISLSGDLK